MRPPLRTMIGMRVGERPSREIRWIGLVVVAAALLVTACTGPEDDRVRIGLLPWAEVTATAQLWSFLLEAEGVATELVRIDTTSPGGIVRTGEVNVVDGVYASLSDGDIDVWTGAWLPESHGPQLAEHDDIEILGTWYEDARLTWAVPVGSELTSIGDLEGRAAELGGEIVGVEPGSGHVRVSREDVLPAYDLDDEYTLSTGSSSSMLAALDRAVALDQPIVVTLWEPHPAYGRYELRNLDDPRGALGAPERIDVLATPGFGERHPDVARWLEAFELDEDALSSLQLRLEASADGDERQAVADWVAEHREEVDGWLGR